MDAAEPSAQDKYGNGAQIIPVKYSCRDYFLNSAAAVTRASTFPFSLFGNCSINLELGFWIDDPEEGKGNIVSDVNFALWRAFKEHGVAIPFPQREVRMLNETR